MNVLLTGPGLTPLVEESAHALGTTCRSRSRSRDCYRRLLILNYKVFVVK